VEDSRHELPPANHFGYRKTRRIPRIYSRDEIVGLVLAATRLSSSDALLPKTYAALISLLAATGLRISEALHLLVSDITPKGLLIRRTKFQKTRLVPLHDTAVTGLGHYLMNRQEARRGGDHVFVSNEGQPLVYWKVHSAFRTLLKSAGFSPPAVDGHAFMTFATRLRSGHWSRLPLAVNESGSICWPWLLTWVTSTSTPPTGTWRPRPNSCATSQS